MDARRPRGGTAASRSAARSAPIGLNVSFADVRRIAQRSIAACAVVGAAASASAAISGAVVRTGAVSGIGSDRLPDDLAFDLAVAVAVSCCRWRGYAGREARGNR